MKGGIFPQLSVCGRFNDVSQKSSTYIAASCICPCRGALMTPLQHYILLAIALHSMHRLNASGCCGANGNARPAAASINSLAELLIPRLRSVAIAPRTTGFKKLSCPTYPSCRLPAGRPQFQLRVVDWTLERAITLPVRSAVAGGGLLSSFLVASMHTSWKVRPEPFVL